MIHWFVISSLVIGVGWWWWNGKSKTRVVISENHEEYQYLNLIRNIVEKGVVRKDRTGTGTISTFGNMMKFSLRDNRFPLLTTKKTFFRGIAEELFFFISGSTNCKILHDKGVKIWDANVSRETLDKIGFKDRPEYDLGPGYSFQWRHAGAEYKDMYTDYSGQGIDQLKNVIEQIKKDPYGRRHIINSWNVKDLPNMSLPPCHCLVQFYVANGELSAIMYQRSADCGLGVPYNIASYSLLTRLVAQVTGLKAGDYIHMFGDTHVYLDHVDALKEQLTRTPYEFPTLEINPHITDIEKFTMDDLMLKNYKCHDKIYMKMSV
jgi:thymidylate synthase